MQNQLFIKKIVSFFSASGKTNRNQRIFDKVKNILYMNLSSFSPTTNCNFSTGHFKKTSACRSFENGPVYSVKQLG